MKRQSSDQIALVYAYGCLAPARGWPEAEMEMTRQNDLWDRLVDVERALEDETLAAAAEDEPGIAAIRTTIEQLSALIWHERTPDLIAARRAARAELWPLLSAWRKSNPAVVHELEVRRRQRVVECRQSSKCYWGNSNRVLDDYERSRRAVKQFGRRLQKHGEDWKGGSLTVQIQRTRSGLGASPAELQDGSFSGLSIGRVDPAAHDPHTFRGDRGRLARTKMEMRIDAAGNMIRLPLIFHRPMPEDGRVKKAQLVWRERGGKLRYQLCLTVSRLAQVVVHSAPDLECNVSFLWTVAADQGLDISVVDGKRLALSHAWLTGMDRVDALPALIDAAEDASTKQRMTNELSGLRSKLLGRRREIYRLFARALAMQYGIIAIHPPALSQIAREDRRSPENALRHRASISSLILEIEHQATKHGAIIRRIPASAPVMKVAGSKTTNKLASGTARRKQSARKSEDSGHENQPII